MQTQIIQALNKYSMGATAATYAKKLDVTSPISHLNVSMTATKAGTTAGTIAHMLTQLGSKIEVKVDGSAVFSGSPADIYYANKYWYGVVPCSFNNESTTDNQITFIDLNIPFVRPFNPHTGDPMLGLETAGKSVEFEITYPADGNNVDARKLSLAVVTHPGSSPRGYIEHLVRSVTPAAAGWDVIVDLPYGAGIGLYDAVFYSTTDIASGTTTDATSIEQVKLELSAREQVLNSVNFEHLTWSNENTGNTEHIIDEYGYVSFDGRKDLADFVPLNQPARFNFYGGDTNAIRVLPGILRLKPAQK